MVLVPAQDGYNGSDCLPCLYSLQEVQEALKARPRHRRSHQLTQKGESHEYLLEVHQSRSHRHGSVRDGILRLQADPQDFCLMAQTVHENKKPLLTGRLSFLAALPLVSIPLCLVGKWLFG